MTKVIPEKLYEQFNGATVKSWQWLKVFEPYKQAYREFEKRVKRNRAFPYYCFASELHYLCSDFGLSKRQVLECLTYQNEVDSVWKFYPLQDPNAKTPSKDFIRCLKINFLNVKPVVAVLTDDLHSFLEHYTTLKDMKSFKRRIEEIIGSARNPSNLVLAINLSRNRDTIKKEVMRIIRAQKKRKQERPKFEDFENCYKVQVCRGLGFTIAKIAQEIWPSQFERSPQATCKKVERLLEKYPA